MNATERKAAELLGFTSYTDDPKYLRWTRPNGRDDVPTTVYVGDEWFHSREARWEIVEKMLKRCGAITLSEGGGVVAFDRPYRTLIEAFVAVCGEENKNG